FGVLDSMEDNSGTRWYQVTDEYVPKIKPRNWSPKPIGWIAENQVIPWRRAVVMRFTNSYNREPSLFFDPPQPVLDLIQEAPDVREQKLRSIREQLESGQGGASGVVAVEPHVGEGQERMIMYPVLDFHASGGKNDLFIDGKFARLLEVAARTRNGASESGNNSVAIDIIFVMDTTHSMRPYLENVLAATKEFAGAYTDDGLRFGFIGYQDKDPQFSYITKEFTSRTLPAVEFVHALAGVTARETPVHGDDIPEAVFEGINTALDSGQWRQEAIKIIFLAGDAPGRDGNLNTTILRNKALTRKIRLFAFHLNNSSISRNRDNVSRKQYADLSSVSEGIKGTAQKQNYLRSIDAGAAQFRQLIADEFQKSLESIDEFLDFKRTGQPLPAAEPGSLKELIFQQATLMYADNTLPDQDITGWVCDKVLTNPDREALTP
ncbi:MAG: VWA domain-containing protein, partial [Candidatus Electrothrix sp. AX5]|nr:VWA domain-containing protein [Candidatus Electrothrix sp. AX5]